MADPYKSFADLQLAMFQAWGAVATGTCEYWRHCLDMQQQFLRHTAAHQRDHVEIASGPSFTDKYGRRCHDIDPERDV